MLKYLKNKLKKKKEAKRFSQIIDEVIATKNRLDDYMFVILEYEKEFLPAQTGEFMEKAEFALTSLISCLYVAKEAKAAKTINDKIKDLQNGK